MRFPCRGFYQEQTGKQLLFSLPDDRKSKGSVLSWFTEWWVVNSGGDLHCFFLLNVALLVAFRIKLWSLQPGWGQRGGFHALLCSTAGQVAGWQCYLPPVTGGHIPTVLLVETTSSTGFSQYFRELMNWETWHFLCLASPWARQRVLCWGPGELAAVAGLRWMLPSHVWRLRNVRAGYGPKGKCLGTKQMLWGKKQPRRKTILKYCTLEQ